MMKHSSSPWFHQEATDLMGLILVYLFTYLLKNTAFKLLVQRMKQGTDQDLKILTVQYPW